MRLTACLLLMMSATLPARAEKPADEKTVEQIAEAARKSVVVVTTPGRDDKRGGLGSGFVVGDGLVATNFHVIGQGQAITVETSDGKKYEATAVHAHDGNLDLAVLKVEAKGLPALPLGDAKALKDGQAVVALGNPRGLKLSVVAGVLSGRRDVEGRPMLQLAMPVEQGNSGGPVLDRRGRVVGVVTSKSAVTENLGFAVSVESLKPLLAKPNSVPMAAWKTIGQLDPDDWKPVLGGRWRQRAGRILVEEMGTGFGGRSYCLWQGQTPRLPYEIAVTVKLDDEAGAAGLIFHADDGKHYGFYPSGGGLRLTRFDGPDVYSWKILEQKPSDAYRAGDWNTLKVRLDRGKIACYVNGTLWAESDDAVLDKGQVGLAKFRNTRAEFKQFRVASKIVDDRPGDEIAAKIRKAIPKTGTAPTPDLRGGRATQVIRDEARRLEEEARRLRRLAGAVHQADLIRAIDKALAGKEPDLLRAALLVAKLDNEELDVETYVRDVERLAKKVRAKFAGDADDQAKREALHKVLFAERGFHGSRGDYYNRSNSYLNEVLDDREGLPITLAVVYLEVARRAGLKAEGVGLPGHFVVRHVPAKGDPQLIDVYDGGRLLSRADAEKKVKDVTGRGFDEKYLGAVPARAVVVRMLNNLLNVAQDERDADAALRYLDAIVALDETAGRERGLRAMFRAQVGDKAGALADLDWVLDKMPEGIDLDAVRVLRRRVERMR